jgi:pimeloyl-ACP methyl ester carboxylesterase
MIGKKFSEIIDASQPDYSHQAAAKAAYDFTFNPRPDSRLNDRQMTLLARAARQVVDVGGNPVQIYDWNSSGTKKALLVHGVGGRCLDYVDIIEILTARGFRVIGFDAPSHGLSQLAPQGVDISNFWQCIERISQIYGNHYDLAFAHSFGSAALTLQMRKNTIHVDNLALFAPNAVFDSIIQGFLKQIKAHRDVFPILCDLTAQRFAERAGVERRELWIGNSTIENIRILAAQASIRNALILHGTKDIMFPHQESEAIASACPPVPCELHVLDSGHKSILSEAQTIQIVSAFCERVLPTQQISMAYLPGYTAHTTDPREASAAPDAVTLASSESATALSLRKAAL